jgi:hypothetical protein
MNEEEALIRAFVVKAKCDRFVELMAEPKRRKDVPATLAHFRDLDPRWIVHLPTNQHDARAVERALRSRGAGDLCYLISQEGDLDRRRLPLADALEQVIGRGIGTLISCIPGSLAYFEGEGPSDRCILARRTKGS